jgi:hypothetical protein
VARTNKCGEYISHPCIAPHSMASLLVVASKYFIIWFIRAMLTWMVSLHTFVTNFINFHSLFQKDRCTSSAPNLPDDKSMEDNSSRNLFPLCFEALVILKFIRISTWDRDVIGAHTQLLRCQMLVPKITSKGCSTLVFGRHFESDGVLGI